jgi:hypothetical protein
MSPNEIVVQRFQAHFFYRKPYQRNMRWHFPCIKSYGKCCFRSFFANSLWYKELANLNSELLNHDNYLLTKQYISDSI